MARDRLHVLAGICALAFGMYCFVIGIGVLAFELTEFTELLLMMCFIYGAIYIIYGIFALMTRPGGMSSFIVVGFFVGTYWWSPGLEWYLWPMIFMPFVILALTVIILIRSYMRWKNGEWQD